MGVRLKVIHQDLHTDPHIIGHVVISCNLKKKDESEVWPQGHRLLSDTIFAF